MPSLRTCPICGVPVKLGNLPSHIARVHPGAKTDRARAVVGSRTARPQTEFRGRTSRTLPYAILGVGLVVASLTLYGFLFTSPPGGGEEPGVRVGAIDLYLQPSCGCCRHYMDYLEGYGFDATAHEMTDLSATKAIHGIPRNMQSCHTSVWGRYFVEGHVPMPALHRLMQEGPAIHGIALPGMPAGSPGMGGMKGAPFVIYALVSGQATVFMHA